MSNEFETGTVTEYDATTKMYVVSLDHCGDVPARRVITGVDKPYPAFARVFCAKSRGMEWAILGELDVPQPDPGDNRPKTVDESAAELDSQIRDIRLASRATELPNFRPLGEEPQFAGDVSIENRTRDQRSRSRVKVFAFGSILSFASNLCFTLWDKRDNQLVTQCRNLIFRAVGFVQTITTRGDDPRTTRRELLQADPLPSQQGTENPAPTWDDRETVEGYIPAPGGQRAEDVSGIIEKPKAERGRRTRFVTHRAEEIDNNQQVRRVRQDHVVYDDKGKETERVQELSHVEGHIDGEGGTAKKGVRTLHRDWLEIQIDNDAHVITITNLGGPDPHRVILTDEHTSIERGAQSLRLDDDGLHIKAKNMNVEVDENIERSAGGTIRDSAPEIHHDN